MPARRLMRWALAAGTALSMASVGISAAAGATPLAALPARATIVIQQGTGKVLFASHASDELPVASTTKLMTAYVTLEYEPVNRMLVEQPYTPGSGESLAPVPVGARLSVADMLRAMLLPSGNNVAYSLAIDVGGSVSHFVSLMNSAAAALGLTRTHYTTPIGLDTPGGNYSTAADLATLTRVLMRDPLMRTIVDKPSARLADGIVVNNRNDLVGAYPWVVGVKTGSTQDAAYCLVAAADLNGVRLISVVLGASSEAVRDADGLALLRYGLSLYRSAQISVGGRVYATVPVKGRARPAHLIALFSSRLVLASTVTLHVGLDGVPRRLRGPLPAGTVEGSIDVRENGRPVESIPLETAAAVPAPRRHPRLEASDIGWVGAGGGLSVILLGCSLPVMRRRATRRIPGVAQ